ncbi:MAG: hypothetical protein GYB67_17560 [Chloroflexi bacterium]|nr:hypothetical protein [Chloroflexota bacterium]
MTANDFDRFLIIFTVTADHLDAVLTAIGDAGAGVIGEYTHCAFAHPGTGRFKPSEAANPTLGAKTQINAVDEYRVETFCDRAQVKPVIAAIRAAHPYEEPVYYILPLLAESDFD